VFNTQQQKELFSAGGAAPGVASSANLGALCVSALSFHSWRREAQGAMRFLGNMEKAKAGPADKFSIQLSVVPAAMRAPATMRTATTRTMWRGSAVARRRIRACWRRVGS
jgi:hypothetical protein